MDHSHGLTIIDLLAIGTVLLSAVLALARGVVREILSLAAWAGAGFASVYFYPLVKPWMHEQIKNPTGADIATGFAVFCGALIFLIPLGIYLASLIKGRALTAIDRSLGFVFGLLRGVVIVCLLYVVTLWVWPTHDKEPAWLAGARTRPVMVYGASMIESWVPRSDLDKAADTVLGRNDGAADINPKSSDGSPAAPSTDGKPAASPATPPGDKPAAYNQQSRSDLNRLIAQPQPQQQPPQQPPQPQPPGRAP